MQDPGPNVLEQQIETNRLLALILAGGAGAAEPSLIQGGAVPVQWPILFYFSNATSHPFTIICNPAGGSADISHSDRHSINGRTGLEMQAAAGVGSWVTAHVDIPHTPTKKVRLQAAVASGESTTEFDWQISLTIYDRTNLYRAMIILEASNAEAFYRNSLGADVSLGQFAHTHLKYAWNKVDLSVDFATLMYHSAIVQAASADLSAQDLHPTADALWPRIRLKFTLMNNTIGEPATGFVDQVLVTPELYDIPE